jgi:hypothetical protein
MKRHAKQGKELNIGEEFKNYSRANSAYSNGMRLAKTKPSSRLRKKSTAAGGGSFFDFYVKSKAFQDIH